MNDAAAAWARQSDADGITWLTFDKPGSSTNVLSRATLLELDSHLRALRESPACARQLSGIHISEPTRPY